MRGASRIVMMTARDQFTGLETLEKAFFSDTGNGYQANNKELLCDTLKLEDEYIEIPLIIKKLGYQIQLLRVLICAHL